MQFPPTMMKAAMRRRPARSKLRTAGLLLAAFAGLALAGGSALPLPPALSPISSAAASELPADPDQAANMLLVEAIEFVDAAEEESDPTARLAALQRAQDNLDRIVRDYAASHVAVQIVTGQTIGTFDPADMAQAITDAEVAHIQAMAARIQAADEERHRFCVDEPQSCTLLDKALATAGTITSNRYRVEILSFIVSVQVELGLLRWAQQTAADAADATYAITNNRGLSHAAPAVVDAQAAAALWTDALQIAELIHRDGERFEAVSAVARAQAEAGLLGTARETFANAVDAAGEVFGVVARDEALAAIASAQAEVELWQEAESTARSITHDGRRSSAFTAIARNQAELGLWEEALSTANAIPGNASRSEALSAIARAQAEAELWDDARNTASSIYSLDVRARTFSEIAHSQAVRGFLDEARQTLVHAVNAADAISSLLNDSSTLMTLARAQAVAGLRNDALDTANIAADAEVEERILAAIVHAQADAGLIDDARSTADMITDDYQRLLTLTNIARAQAEMGLFDEAQRTLADAANSAHAVADLEDRSVLLSRIAHDQAGSGQQDVAQATFARALDTSQEIRSDWERSYALATIVTDLAWAGRWSEAHSAAQAIPDQSIGDIALRNIAAARAQAAVAALGER